MRFLSVLRVPHGKTCEICRAALSHLHLQNGRSLSSSTFVPSFGIAFDIDGVILRGRTPIGGSPVALRRLYSDCGALKIPFLFLTNGGGIPEARRAYELGKLLEVIIKPLQVVQGHSPFKDLVNRFENELIIATGKGEPAAVMSEYGFKKVLSIDEYASYFNDIDPLAQHKTWGSKQAFDTKAMHPRFNVFSEEVQAAFVVSDPVDWGRDIQVLCDILRSGGLPGRKNGGHQPSLFFAADDLEYQASFPSERLGMGAFRIALESIFNRIHHDTLKYTSFGKPNPSVFKNAEGILKELWSICYADHHIVKDRDTINHPFKTIYMIGDNPSVDIKGARKAGHPWFSILTRTGVFKGKENDSHFPADVVVDTVEEAVDYILRKEAA
ncbi:uncharacterized protein YKR070W isoform X2 [Magnolia sinica]|uniref:uncharacterized protein YKR070W isoform X2 n=1 Tax=Magnolia sinica TaxID=86752 RepID=UPI00265A3DAA|nr:uncharacterized protein YKR070W isoform X2 [Magnolia sinica]